MSRKYIYLIVWISLITYASLTPSDTVPKFTIPHFDKIVHWGIYLVLAVLLIPVFRNKEKGFRKAYFFSFVTASVLGAVFEILQYAIATGRSFSAWDELANTIGALSGIGLYRLFIANKKIEKIMF